MMKYNVNRFIRFSITFWLFIFSAGCVTGGTQTKMNNISVGMTKSEVIEVMGQPDSASATEGVEYLIYQLKDGTDGGTAAACAGMGVLTLGIGYMAPECRGGVEKDFFVRFANGQVDAYGRVGDFDSTKTPEATINVNTKSTPSD